MSPVGGDRDSDGSRDPHSHRLQLQETMNGPGDLVAVDRAGRVLGDVPGGEEALGRDAGDSEPQHEQQHHRGDQPATVVGSGPPQPDPGESPERPHLRPTERAQPPQPERQAVPAGEMAVDRREADRDDHRVRLRAQEVVRVRVAERIVDREHEHAGEGPRGVRGITTLRLGIGQPESDPPGEDDAAQRDRHRGDHPQPQRVVTDDRVGHREQERQRLPGGRAVGV